MAQDTTAHVKAIIADLTVEIAGLRATQEALREQLAAVTAERDAAVHALKQRRKRKRT